jgi:DNA (cytosine-5)-methyltransferase 1
LSSVTAGGSLVLSIFPGIDLLGRGFEAEGFAVVRGPDLIYGSDIFDFHCPAGRFDGVIAGSPCQDYSRARRTPPSGYSDRSIAEFQRVVTEAAPTWWLLENVAAVPDVLIPGCSHLRIDLDARDCGSRQARLRHFQFGHVAGLVPIVTRLPRLVLEHSQIERCCTASEGSRPDRRTWANFCELQGLPRDFELPGMTLVARYRAVGNGVPIPMARTIAAAIRAAVSPVGIRLCACGCARFVTGRQSLATAACRKRMQRRRDSAGVTDPGMVTPGTSRVTDLAAVVRAPSRQTVSDLAAPAAAASL